jgi:hypothetical protein
LFLSHGSLIVSISHSSPTPPYISSTAAILACGTSVILHEKRFEICCFPGKVMDKRQSFGTHYFSPSIILETFTAFQAQRLLDLLLGGRTMCTH